MKLYLDGILVVEGKEDASYLSNYVSSEIVVVNGYELAEQTLSYLKDKKIIVMTDPDEAGIQIRKKINEIIPNSINVEVDINKCTRGKKSGIAECEIEEILKKLMLHVPPKIENVQNVKLADLQKIGLLNNVELRNYICGKINLGKCNNKQLIKRINSNKIKIENIEKIVKEYYGN